jgi:hypothetical protein
MTHVAIVLSYGRPELGELLTMWERQTMPLPLLVWLDECPVDVTAPSPRVHVHRSARIGGRYGIGGVRAAAVAYTRERYALESSDAFLVLDDDDFYSTRHAELTVRMLAGSTHGWTGSLRTGIQWGPDGPPELMRAVGGPGAHATWAMTLASYDAAGGYLESENFEDVGLARRLQGLPPGPREWSSDRCSPHSFVTHVRRQFGFGYSAHFDRQALHGVSREPIRPMWRPQLDALERWCRSHVAAL